MKRVFLIVLTLNNLISCSQKEKLTELEKQSNLIIEDFFSKVLEKKYDLALNDLLSANENMDLQDSLTIALQKRFTEINQVSGKIKSKRLLRKKQLDNDLGVYTYLVKYEKKFYRFVFIFYNNEEQVKIYKFSLDDHIDIELEESIKLYVN